jgi:hypothetical protein
MASKSGDSKQGLIIALVFCVLIIIGLGVTAYYGFADQQRLTDEAKKAKADMQAIQKDRDANRYLNLLYRAYIGAPGDKLDELGELGATKGAYDANASKDKDKIDKVIAAIDQRLQGWDAAANKPKKTYNGELQALAAQLTARTGELDQLKTDAEGTKERYQQLLTTSEKEKKELADKLTQAGKKAETDLSKYLAQIQEQQKALDQLGQTLEAEKKKADQTVAGANTEVARYKKAIADLQANIERLQDQLPKFDIVEKDQPKGRIVSIDRSGSMPYIDLGSADNVKPQLTFTVYGVGPDGRALRQAKATVEVINVVSDHRSQARVTSVKDPNRDPLVPGDLLFNPAWSPSMQQHVAIIGVIDINGDLRGAPAETQMRALNEFKRSLESQGMVVDAYLDLKDLKMKGEMGRQTDFLILGDTPEQRLGDTKENDPKAERAVKMGALMTDMQKKAVANAVTVINVRKFLAVTGHKSRGADTEPTRGSLPRSTLSAPGK